MARGAFGVPRPRILGTFSVIDLIRSAWLGSPMTGMGPPPWQTAMTGAGIVWYSLV
jgi:hypothetical protein